MTRRKAATSSEVAAALASLAESAINALFAKRDNQVKLASANADERHLYVLMEDEAAAGRFQISAPLLPCPEDPEHVIDVLWVSPLFVPAYIFQAHPGASEWRRFEAATGIEARL